MLPARGVDAMRGTAMFCPKCGKEVPENASYCGGCGSKLSVQLQEAMAASVPKRQEPSRHAGLQVPRQAASAAGAEGQSPEAARAIAGNAAFGSVDSPDRFVTGAIEPPATSSASASASVSSFSAVGIVSRVASIAALVCMFFPWLRVDAFNSAGQIGALFGLQTGKDYAYSMFQLRDAFDAIDDFASTGSLGRTLDLFFFAWIAVVVVLVTCLLVSFAMKSKSSRVVIVGAMMAVLLALAWLWYVGAVNGSANSSLNVSVRLVSTPPAVWLTALFGVVSTALAIADRPKAAKLPA